MKITEIKINRYKAIQEPFILDHPGKLHIFIGENNSGKTNILNAMNQIFVKDNPNLTDKKSDLSIKLSLNNNLGKELIVRQAGVNKFFTIDNEEISEKKAINILNKHIIRLCATKEFNFNNIKKDYLNFKTKYQNEFKWFYDTLNRYIPKIKHSSKLESNTVFFQNLGAGFQQVFITLMYLFHPQYTILLLEEPEIHLHPALVKKLLTIIERENLNNQIFMTTHSPLFIHTTNLHRLFRVTRDAKSTKVFSPRLTGHRLNYTRLKQELNADNCEMFFADKVLLVEGPSDHILMRELIDRFYKDKKNIKVIQTYGKSNIDVYTELLEIFNIPYAVLLDLDALYDTGIKIIQSRIKEKFTEPERILINTLKKYGIFIFPNGSIEKNYPHKYQRRRKHKPQNALYASSHINESEYNSNEMKYIKEVIDKL